MKSPLVSVIVPVYKVYAFLQKAVDSVIGQTCRMLEVLLVDDGSPDSCPEVCDEYLVTDARIITVHKTNGGLSDARNFGLELFSGQYVAFLDSDDYYAETALARLTETAMAQNADMVVCSVAEIDEVGNGIQKSSYVPLGESLYASESALLELTAKRERTMTVVWDKLYRRELWYGVRFPVGKIHEDVFTTYKLMAASVRIATIPDPLYMHRIRGGSIMTTRKAWSYQCAMEALTELLDFFVAGEMCVCARNTDVHCFEQMKSAYWSGYWQDPGVSGAVSCYRRRYGHMEYRERLTQIRMNLFGVSPLLERVADLLYRKALSVRKEKTKT